jgi:hypothetical protein
MSKRGYYLGGHTVIRGGTSSLLTDGKNLDAKEKARQRTLKVEGRKRLLTDPVVGAPIEGEREADLARTSEIRQLSKETNIARASKLGGRGKNRKR